MQAQGKETRRLRPRRKRLRWWLVAIVFLLGTLYLLRQPLFGSMIAEEVSEALSDALGVPVVVSRVEGSWIADARVTQIRIDAAEARGALVRFDADAIEVHFSLWEVLFGDVIEGIQSIKAENVLLALDFTRPTAESAGEPASIEEVVAAVPPAFPPLDVTATLDITTGAGRFTIEDVAITRPEASRVSLKASQIHAPEPVGPMGALDASIRRTRQGIVWESATTLAGVRLDAVTVSGSGTVAGKGTVAGAPIRFSLSPTGAEVETGEMRVTEVPPWAIRLIPDPLLRPSRGALTLTARATSFDPLVATLALDGRDIAFPRRTVHQARLRGTFEAGRLAATLIDVQGDDLNVLGHDLVFDLSGEAPVPQSLASLRVRTNDLSAFVSAVDRPVAVDVELSSRDGRVVSVSRLALTGDGVDLEGRGRVELPDVDRIESARLDLALAGYVRDVELDDLRIDGRLELDVQATGTVGRPVIAGQVTGRELGIRDVLVRHLDARLRYAAPRLEIEELKAAGAGVRVEAQGLIDLEALLAERFAASVEVDDLTQLAFLLPRGTPALAGGLAARVTWDGSLEDGSGSVAARFTRLRVDGVEVGTGAATIAAEGGRLEVSRLSSRAAWGDVLLGGHLNPNTGRGRIERLQGSYRDKGFELKAPLAVNLEGGLALTDLDLEAFGGRIGGSLSLGDETRLDLIFDSLALSSLLPLVAPDMTPPTGALSGRVELSPATARVELEVPRLEYEGHTGRVQVRLVREGERLRVESLDIDAGKLLVAQGQGTLPFRLDDRGRLRILGADADFSIAIKSAELDRIDGLPAAGLDVTLTGGPERLSLKGAVERLVLDDDVDPLGRIELDVRADGTGLRLEARLAEANRLAARLRLQSPEAFDWATVEGLIDRSRELPVTGKLTVERLEAQALMPYLPDVVTSVDGALVADIDIGGRLPYPTVRGHIESTSTAFHLRDVEGPVTVADLRVEVEDERVRIRRARLLWGSAALESRAQVGVPQPYTRGWARQPTEGRATLSIPELGVLNTLLDDVAPLSGGLRADITVEGPLEKPQVRGRVSGEAIQFTLPGTDLRLDVPTLELVLERDVLRVEGVRLAHEGNALDVTGQVLLGDAGLDDLETARLDLHGTLSGSKLGFVARHVEALDELGGTLRGKLRATGPLSAPRFEGTIEGEQLRVRLAELRAPVVVSALRVEATSSEIRLEPLRLQIEGSELTVEGRLERPARLDGDWARARLTGDVRVEARDLGPLSRYVDALRRTDGSLDARFTVAGSIDQPTINGHADLRDVTIALDSSFPSIGPVNGRLDLQDSLLRTRDLQGAIGRGPLRLSGSVDMADIERPVFDLALKGQHLLLVRDRDLKLRADADLVIKGPWVALTGTGELQITDLVYAASMDLVGGSGGRSPGGTLELFSFGDEPLDTMTLDVRVRAQNTIRIRTNILRGNASADFRVRGTGREPSIDGRLSFPGMDVALPFSRLEVERGVLRWDQSAPGEPVVDAVANALIRGYQLLIRARGPLSGVSLSIASRPTLPQDEAVLLLTTGATSQSLREEGLARAALTRLGSLVGESLFSGGSDVDDPDEESFFDRFEFIQGRRISVSGEETLEAEFKVSDRFYLRGERDRYDDINVGVVWRWKFR